MLENQAAPETATETLPAKRRPRGQPFLPGNRANPLGRNASVVRREAEALEREVEIAALVADLGRPPSAAERLLIEQAADLAARGRRLRKQGKSAIEDERLLVRILRMLGIGKPAKPVHIPLRDRWGAEAASEGATEAIAEAAPTIAVEAGAPTGARSALESTAVKPETMG